MNCAKPQIARLMVMALGSALFGVTAVARDDAGPQATTAPQTSVESQQANYPLPLAQARLLAELIRSIRRQYVEPRTDAQLLEAAARGMVSSLDPYSSLLDSTAEVQFKSETAGTFSGIGLELVSISKIVHVRRVMQGSPADLAGLQAGDELHEINGTDVQPINQPLLLDSLRGKPGDIIRLLVQRDTVPEPFEVRLRRGMVSTHSVDAQCLQQSYAYLRVGLFTATTAQEIHEHLRDLAGCGTVRGLILDLRNNPGGLVDAAVEVADDFLESGLIVTAEGRDPASRYRRSATPGDVINGAPIVVLINGGTASAAEILAAALRDNGRARLMGTRSFGKGTLQAVLSLSGGRGISLTTAHYLTPSGRSISDRGLEPETAFELWPLPWGGLPASNDPALVQAVALLTQH